MSDQMTDLSNDNVIISDSSDSVNLRREESSMSNQSDSSELETLKELGIDLNLLTEIKEQSNQNSRKKTTVEKEETLTPEQIMAKLDDEKDETDVDDSDESNWEQPDQDSDEGEDTDDDSLLEYELLVNGEQVKKSLSKQQVVDELQKAHVFTHNSQQLAEEKRQFELESEQAVSDYEEAIESFQQELVEYQEHFQDKKKWDYFLDIEKDSDPDFYDMVVEKFANFNRQYDNPLQRSAIESLKAEIEDLKRHGKVSDIEKQQQEYSREMEMLQLEYGPVSEKLGFKPDWDQVGDKWADLGTGSLKDAFQVLYGPTMNKLYKSKGKVAAAAKIARSSKKVPTGAGSARRTASLKKDVSTGKMDYFEMINTMSVDDLLG